MAIKCCFGGGTEEGVVGGCIGNGNIGAVNVEGGERFAFVGVCADDSGEFCEETKASLFGIIGKSCGVVPDWTEAKTRRT